MRRGKQYRINFIFAALLAIGISYFLPSLEINSNDSLVDSSSISFCQKESVNQDSDIYAEDSDTEDSIKKKCIVLFCSEVRFQQDYYTPRNFFYINKKIEPASLLIMHNLPPPVA